MVESIQRLVFRNGESTDLYLGTERVHIKEERKRNMVKKSKQILDNKMLVAQCPHMMNQSALRMQLPAVSRPFQAVG